jgi:ABC-type multidrug transport system ATPase subunit
MNNAITASDLVKTYPKGKVKALDGLSLEVEEGTVLGVLGPNGAGKTTCVRVLATLLKPDSGSATVAGVDVIKNPENTINYYLNGSLFDENKNIYLNVVNWVDQRYTPASLNVEFLMILDGLQPLKDSPIRNYILKKYDEYLNQINLG